MQNSAAWEENGFSASQEFPLVSWTWVFITTTICPPSSARSIQSTYFFRAHFNIILPNVILQQNLFTLHKCFTVLSQRPKT